MNNLDHSGVAILAWPLWRGKDSNLRSVNAADLQSAPFGHSGTPPLSEATNLTKVYLLKSLARRVTLSVAPGCGGRMDSGSRQRFFRASGESSKVVKELAAGIEPAAC